MHKWKKFGLASALTASIGLLGASIISGADSAAETPVAVLGVETAATEGEMTVQEVVKKTMPAMVAITTTEVEEVRNYFSGRDFDFDEFFGDYFFGRGYGGFGGYGGYGGYDDDDDDGGSTQTREYVSMGSGVIVGMTDDDILIATNEHVVSSATTLSVAFVDDTAAEAEMVGSAASHDLAVIKVAKSDVEDATLDAISVIPLGSSSDLEIGETVIAIGNALGYGQSVSKGIVSALNRSIASQNEVTGKIETTDGMIQTDASINPGNSGGALLNTKGELIGINSAKYADTQVEGMGYAIPVDTAEPILTDLANGKTVDESPAVNDDGSVRLGITAATITEDYATSYSIPTGVYVSDVENGGTGDLAGLQSGDIITAIDGQELTTVEDLKDALANYELGDSAELTVSRETQSPFGNDTSFVEGNITVTFGETDSEETETEEDADVAA